MSFTKSALALVFSLILTACGDGGDEASDTLGSLPDIPTDINPDIPADDNKDTPLGGKIGFAATEQTVREGSVAEVTVTRTNGKGEANVSYGTRGVTAVSSTRQGDDYQGFDPKKLTFADGETSKVVRVKTLDNALQESAETFEIYLTSPSAGYSLDSDAVVTIIDNDGTKNQPPVISGSPKTKVTAGTDYSFSPRASDPDGDNLTFSASNLPAWLSIDSGTGVLSGTPLVSEVGVYNNIQIAVSDGTEQIPLDSFSITVNAADVLTGSMSLSWSAPSTRLDGSSLSLSEIDGYCIYLGTSSDNLEMFVDVNDGAAIEYNIENLEVGTYYVAVTTYDADGNDSSFSNVVEKRVTN